MTAKNSSRPPEPIAPGGAKNLELEMILQQPPLRQVPQSFKSALRRKLLWPTGIFFFIGLIFSLVGIIIVGAFFPGQVKKEIKLSSGAKASAFATVSSCGATGFRENKARVYKIYYEFTTPDGKSHRGFSYQTGAEVRPGAKVQVEYLNDDPEINRIMGMRLSPFGYWMLIFSFFPVVGLILLVYSIRTWSREWRKGMRLFESGMLAQGAITSVQKTNVRVNNQYRYKVSVSYMSFETFYHAYGDDVVRASNWQGSNTPVRVLYNPEQPEDAIVLEGILRAYP